ncbi:carbohydrate ABC transporter permease [Rhodococcus sp. MEB064]|uniref:carbohydrate ABC transporter permease n=1 Tax=Rhodococcus sp. MEB064 TaxID=1587522 RepID=UPI0005ABF521|nr:sugar ABC transporter permease [Rhodococcus sp. MEB064]KIQ10867.1 transporter [Rhodococcus sp. MEB064]
MVTTITPGTGGTPTATSPAPVPRKRSSRRISAPYILIAPVVLLLVVFIFYPVGSVFYYSLQYYNPTTPWENGFAGLENFRLMFADELFWTSLLTTGKWVLFQVVFQLVLGLGLALLVNEVFRGRGLARALVFSPWAVSGVLTTGIWLLIYNPSTGIFKLLGDMGIGDGTAAPIADPDTAFWATGVAELWRGVPFFAILILAELQSAPKDLYEAANVDGASRWQRFRFVTLPHLKAVIILSTLLRGVWEFNNVDLLYTLTAGGPADVTTTLPLYVSQLAITAQDFGYGSALTTVAFLILLFCSILYLRLSKFNAEKG